MEYATLGSTGLKPSVAGLGCGGNSRLGLGTGATKAEAIALVRTAHDLGINFFDTARVYGTEPVVGAAVEEIGRDKVIISTKSRVEEKGEPLSAHEVLFNLERSLQALNTDYIDIFHLHGVSPIMYRHARDVIAPVLLREREKGKFRFLGITETSPNDPEQSMLDRAFREDPFFDVVMFAFNLMNHNARRKVFPNTLKREIGTLIMFAVRNVFSKPSELSKVFEDLSTRGLIVPAASIGNPLEFLLNGSGATNITDAAYRFARHEPGVDVVLFGTGDAEHLRSNIVSILSPPLPSSYRDRLAAFFGHLTGIGLDLPDHVAMRS